MRNQLQLAVTGRHGVAIDLPETGARAYAGFDEDGQARVSVQGNAGKITLSIEMPKEASSTKSTKLAKAKTKAKSGIKRARVNARGVPKKEAALARVKKLTDSGRPVPTVSAIAKIGKVSIATADRWLKGWQDEGLVPEQRRYRKRRAARPMTAARKLNGHLNGHHHGTATMQ